MSYLLDTNICIAHLKKNDQKLIDVFQRHDPTEFFLCSVVKAELLYGARKSARIDDNLKLLEIFFAPFVSLPFEDKAAEYYGILRTVLEKGGQPIGASDMIIGSIALAENKTVVTRNRKEFIRIPGLRVEEW